VLSSAPTHWPTYPSNVGVIGGAHQLLVHSDRRQCVHLLGKFVPFGPEVGYEQLYDICHFLVCFRPRAHKAAMLVFRNREFVSKFFLDVVFNKG
jgi:hypothetical protein